jgi:hypothetical protein
MDGSRTSRDFSLVNAKKKKKNCWDNYYFDHAMTTWHTNGLECVSDKMSRANCSESKSTCAGLALQVESLEFQATPFGDRTVSESRDLGEKPETRRGQHPACSLLEDILYMSGDWRVWSGCFADEDILCSNALFVSVSLSNMVLISYPTTLRKIILV